MFVLRYVGTEGKVDNYSGPVPPGAFIESYDPEAYGGRGEAKWTLVLGDAMQFVSVKAATDCIRQIPANRPFRPDGKVNRPLTAFSLMVEEVTA